jgi:hypothetical protein
VRSREEVNTTVFSSGIVAKLFEGWVDIDLLPLHTSSAHVLPPERIPDTPNRMGP